MKKRKNKKLKIAQIAPCWYPIPPEKYGGIERIIFHLCQELSKRGHEVTLFASGNSKTKAKLVPVYPTNLVKLKIPWQENILNIESLIKAYEKNEEYDILHSHLDHLGLFLQNLIKIPIVHTFHNPMSLGEKTKISSKALFYKIHGKNTLGVFISKNQKENCFAKFKKSWVAYNGVDLDKFRFNPEPKNYFLWTGRLDPYKGIENAIKAAEISGINLVLIGKIDEGKEEYFIKKIKPRLSEKIRYLGELPQEKLIKYYQEAKAFLYPIEWEEPFGLVMAESMACGTPVIAFKRGSVPEIIQNGKTGFVVRTVFEMAKAIKKTDRISRYACRQRVEKLFTIQNMADNYEKIYYQVLNEKNK